MIYYRLLRDNKESGPFSEEEMIAKGFKPYDLLWVEGKSAGWRYPSEIAVFKNFAPVVEEQPYDRFYKKQPPQKLYPAEEKSTNVSFAPQPSKENNPAQPQQPAVSRPAYNYNVQAVHGRHIHVTLPSGNTLNLTTLVAKKENAIPKEAAEINRSTPVNTEKKQPSFAESIYSPQQTVIKENKTIEPAVEEMQAKKTTVVFANQPISYQPAPGFSWTLVSGAVIGIATMIGLGIMIGLSMNREKNDIAFNEALRNKSKSTVVASRPKPVAVIPAGIPDVQTDEALQSSSAATNKELVQNAVVKRRLAPDNAIKKDIKPSPVEKTETEKNNAVQNNEPPASYIKPAPLPVNIEPQLTLSANNFKTGAFGGISGLKYTLFNGSKFSLESVEVEVDYIQANNKVYKTEKILFKAISAGAGATVEAPSSSRGVKIMGRIIKINPKEAALTNNTAKS